MNRALRPENRSLVEKRVKSIQRRFEYRRLCTLRAFSGTMLPASGNGKGHVINTGMQNKSGKISQSLINDVETIQSANPKKSLERVKGKNYAHYHLHHLRYHLLCGESVRKDGTILICQQLSVKPLLFSNHSKGSRHRHHRIYDWGEQRLTSKRPYPKLPLCVGKTPGINPCDLLLIKRGLYRFALCGYIITQNEIPVTQILHQPYIFIQRRTPTAADQKRWTPAWPFGNAR